MRLVAETIDTDLESLRSMNPELLRLVTPPDPEFVLRLPEGTAERFFAEIAAIPPEKWVSWRRHKVEQGETLSSIAKQYRVSPAEVADANELATGASLEEGQKLIIPAAARSEASTGKLIRYRVRRTDTIATIADEFDVTPAELRKWNHLRADHVVRGMSLRIYPGGMTPAPAQQQAKTKDPAPGATVAQREWRGAARPSRHGSALGEHRRASREARRNAVVDRPRLSDHGGSHSGREPLSVQPASSGGRYADHPADPLVPSCFLFRLIPIL